MCQQIHGLSPMATPCRRFTASRKVTKLNFFGNLIVQVEKLLYVRLIRIALASLVLVGFWYLMKFDIGLILISVVGVPLALHIVTAPLLTVMNVINDRITMKGFGRQFTQQLEQELRS